MKKCKKYKGDKLNEQKLQKMSELSLKAYNITSILKVYCENSLDIIEIANISSVINYLYDDIDKLNSILIDTVYS